MKRIGNFASAASILAIILSLGSVAHAGGRGGKSGFASHGPGHYSGFRAGFRGGAVSGYRPVQNHVAHGYSTPTRIMTHPYNRQSYGQSSQYRHLPVLAGVAAEGYAVASPRQNGYFPHKTYAQPGKRNEDRRNYRYGSSGGAYFVDSGYAASGSYEAPLAYRYSQPYPAYAEALPAYGYAQQPSCQCGQSYGVASPSVIIVDGLASDQRHRRNRYARQQALPEVVYGANGMTNGYRGYTNPYMPEVSHVKVVKY